MSTISEQVNGIYKDSTEDELAVEITNDGGLKVQTLEDATRYAYGLSETYKSIEQFEAIAQSEIDKWQEKIKEVTTWLETVTAPLKEKAEYLSNQLTAYHVNEYNNAPNEKAQKKLNSIKLPYNITLKSRALSDKLEVADNDAYLQYAKENELVKVKEEVDWASLKKNIIINSDGRALNKETGEFLDFISVTPQERKFEVK